MAEREEPTVQQLEDWIERLAKIVDAHVDSTKVVLEKMADKLIETADKVKKLEQGSETQKASSERVIPSPYQ